MKKIQIKQFAKKQGWSLFGVVDYEMVAKNLKKHQIIFEEWVKQGFQSDMHYLEKMKEDRFHLENKISDIKSVIVVGAWYGQDTGHRIQDTGHRIQGAGCRIQDTASISRYAQGKDYHKILKKKLIELSNYLKRQALRTPNSELRTYISVDSGPTVDRALAEMAGLGFFGKNSCIINPQMGSYFFIGVMLTNLELPPTSVSRMPNCGDCTRCLNSCPTGALVSPGVLDANKCIAYLTIENKGGIPVELRPKIGNRFFGCDICQEVCPFNIGRAHKQEVLIKELKAECGVGDSLDLREILSIKTDEQFSQKFAGTPLMRAKRRGLIRNACIVAGNSGDETLIPDLKNVRDREDDEMLKEHAEWGIETISNCSNFQFPNDFQ